EDMQAQSRVRYRLRAREPGSYDIGVEVVDVHGEAILHSGYYYYQISKSDHEVISELINAMRQQVRTRALPLALMLSKALIEEAAEHHAQGRHQDAYEALYWEIGRA